ncbi:hypothetical protein [Marivita sp. S2033]|uniref:hypothetical protein n=1 Tax=Marivita sp. S2033 TaxID=3373187 RepID=UPI0039823796
MIELRFHFSDKRFGGCRVVRLKMSIDRVVDGMRVMIRNHVAFLRLGQDGSGTARVPGSRFLPKTETGEDMRRHVQRMGHFRCDGIVAPCDFHRAVGKSGVILGVNGTVIARRAWMRFGLRATFTLWMQQQSKIPRDQANEIAFILGQLILVSNVETSPIAQLEAKI